MKKFVIGGLLTAVVVAAAAFGAGLAAAAEPAPAPTAPSLPILVPPIDASQGLFGIQRGTVPALTTPDLSQVPGAGVVPGLQLDALPTTDPESAGQ